MLSDPSVKLYKIDRHSTLLTGYSLNIPAHFCPFHVSCMLIESSVLNPKPVCNSCICQSIHVIQLNIMETHEMKSTKNVTDSIKN